MANVKLQYSLVCERDQNSLISRIVYGFKPGPAPEFYISNHWVWDDCRTAGDGFYQVTEIFQGEEVLAASFSRVFQVRDSHTHHNRFQGLVFSGGSCRVRVELFDREGIKVEKGCCDYPLPVRDRGDVSGFKRDR